MSNIGFVLLAVSSLLADPASAPTLKSAHSHLQQGRIGEAQEEYEALLKQPANLVPATLGLSQAHEQEGEWGEAEKIVLQGLKASPDQPELSARLGEIALARGRFAEALKLAEGVLINHADHPQAHWVKAEALTELGRISDADSEYRWAVRYYNKVQPKEAASLLLVGKSSAQYARWHPGSQIFNFVVNTLTEDVLKDDSQAWPAHLLAGTLLLEKYNREQALPEFRKGLAINPRSADLLAALGEADWQQLNIDSAKDFADRALAIHPGHPVACRLLADLAFRDGEAEKALASLKPALAINPHDQRTLARQAVAYLMLDGIPATEEWKALLAKVPDIGDFQPPKKARAFQLIREVAQRNPAPGYFLQELGEQLEQLKRFEPAELCYLAAQAAIPGYSPPKTSLGMLYMRVGRGDEARKTLDQAFEADPFHIRVSNMRKVMKLLEGYQTVTSDHFVIRVDAQHDQLLAQYMLEYLEEEYPKLTQQFGFEPPQRTQFEIYSSAKGLSAHQWFSSRMVGLPWIQTIGASTGMIVALTSPTAQPEPFNWAKVVKHEFVHIITLQQTNFNCPHWFTEALAVLNEESPRPESWTRLLLERVPKDDLKTLDNINLGFQRARNQEEWNMAYCQSHLYAQYLIKTQGRESLGKMLTAYRDGASTAQAIQKVCGISQAEFEKGYKAYLQELVKELSTLPGEPVEDLPTLRKMREAKPDDLSLKGAYAFSLLQAQQAKQARKLAEEVLQKDSHQPLAALTVALLELKAEDRKSARKILEEAHQAESPNALLIQTLAKLRLQDQDLSGAAELYKLAQTKDPDNSTWTRGLASVYLKTGNMDELTPVLERLAELDFDNPTPRKKLAEIYFKKGNFEKVIHYGQLALHCDVMDAETHQTLAKAYRELKQSDKALREWKAAVLLLPDDADAVLELAKVLVADKQIPEAKKHLQAFVTKHPEALDAAEYLKTLEK